MLPAQDLGLTRKGFKWKITLKNTILLIFSFRLGRVVCLKTSPILEWQIYATLYQFCLLIMQENHSIFKPVNLSLFHFLFRPYTTPFLEISTQLTKYTAIKTKWLEHT